MSNRGGQRIGAGRKVGSQNKVTQEQRATLSELAQTYADDAIKSLHEVATKGDSESARVSACTAILDRAYGRPVQPLQHSGNDGGPIKTKDVGTIELARRIAYVLHKGMQAKKKQEKCD